MTLARHHYIDRRPNHVSILYSPRCVCGFEKPPGRAFCQECRCELPPRLAWHVDTCTFRWFLPWWRLATRWIKRSMLEPAAPPAQANHMRRTA